VRIEADAVIPFPRDVVFRAYRDELPQVAAFIPNVRSIEVRSRTEEGSAVKLHNVWHGGGDIPAAVRAVVDEKVLSWDDFASWDAGSLEATWKIRTHAFTEAVSCSGTTRILPVGEHKSRVELTGEFAIDARRISGIPSMLAGSIGKTVESFLARQIMANLASTTEALSRYLASKS
jgi:hypothetical protein